MKDAVGYLRVSTKEQGRSGLGLAAQRADIEAFGAREGFAMQSWYQDVQTGAGKDALLLRHGLAAALKDARIRRCPLIVSRLDRLSRNVHFIAGLMEHKVHFVVAAFGRDCDNFTLHIYASLAEQERKMIGERIRAAKAIAKLKGAKFGLQLMSKAKRRRVIELGIVATQKAASERAEAYRLHIEWALRQPGLYGRPIAFTAAATKLNDRNIESPMGGRWTGSQLSRMARRLTLDHSPASLRLHQVRSRVRALWRNSPNLTGKQLIERLGLEHRHLLGVARARQLLRECRTEAAKRSTVHAKVGWRPDVWTAQRIRISKTLKRHPEYTAKQMLKALGPNTAAGERWVGRVMNECWHAVGGKGAHRCPEWTPARRKQQARRILMIRPWDLATGPRTVKGKARSAKNGLSGGIARRRDW